MEQLLGQGSYGRVFKARRTADGKLYAIKQMSVASMSTTERQGAMNEVPDWQAL